MSITRRLPKSNPARLAALRAAADKKNTYLPGASFLTPTTDNRLDTILGQYESATTAINVSRVTLLDLTANKNVAMASCRMFTSHFLQTLTMAVDRNVFPKSVLAYYELTASSPTVPAMNSEGQVNAAALATINGETLRTGAGGIAIPFPAISEVQAEYNTFHQLLMQQTVAADQLDNAQETRSSLNTEADAVIKKVWDEVETYYNEEAIQSKRANAREWGVVYISDTRISITGRVVNAVANSPLPMPVGNATVVIIEADDTTITNAAGEFDLKTGMTGTATIEITADGFQPFTMTQNIEGESINLGDILLTAL